MKKLKELGIAGLLVIIGNSANALEINVKGYPVPEINKDPDYIGFIARKNTSGKEVRGNFKEYEEGSNLILEFTFNGKIEGYSVRDNAGPKKSYYFIQDSNCDGIFESKYSYEEAVIGVIPVPDCYLKQ